MDHRAAATLWLLVARRASIIVAAGPRLAGKTTVLEATMDLVPPRFQVVRTRGEAEEDFAFLASTPAFSSYILVPELSDHTADYLWGAAALRVFEALDRGYSLAATMHADTPEGVLAELVGGPLTSKPALARHVTAIVTLRLVPTRQGIVRRVACLAVAPPEGEPPGRMASLAEWQKRDDAFRHVPVAVACAALGQRLGATASDLERELADRTAALGRWLRDGVADTAAVRRAAGTYREASPPRAG